MNSYEWPTPNPAPKPTHHWGVDKSYIFVRISHLIKYIWIGREIALGSRQIVQVRLYELAIRTNWLWDSIENSSLVCYTGNNNPLISIKTHNTQNMNKVAHFNKKKITVDFRIAFFMKDTV